MTWLNDLTRAFGSEKKGWMSQLYNWQIPGKTSEYYPSGKASLKELYSPGGYLKGGEFIREGVTSRVTTSATGLFGIGAVEYAQGKEGWFPDWGRPGEHDKIVDTSGEGGGLINITIPEFPEFPGWPEIPKIDIPDFPKIPDLPKIPEWPEIPKIDIPIVIPPVGGGLQLVDDEGEPNLLLMGGLALLAYKVLSGGKK